MNDVVAHELAGLLAQEARLGVPRAVAPLPGGRNNRVFRVSLEGGNAAILKCYHHDPRDPRDRLKAEWSFLTYVYGLGVRNVPQPLAAQPAHHAALYSFVAGERALEVSEELSRQAAEFVEAINSAPDQSSALAPASEACFSLGDHLAAVESRIARVQKLDADERHVEQARNFVESQLISTWDAVKTDIIRQASGHGISLAAAIGREIVSPSDFGFHNALIDARGHASFIDFEYAGRDDPAKLICDFFCQPELPVRLDYYEEFTERIAASLHLDEMDLWRARLLLNAYRIKWVCIMLNEFSAVGARRRTFASNQDYETRAALQLCRAERYLTLIKS